MKAVASLGDGVFFKKAFCDVAVFTQFVKDLFEFPLNLDKLETEKSFDPPIGTVNSWFEVYAEDQKNRVLVDIQPQNFSDHYQRFLGSDALWMRFDNFSKVVKSINRYSFTHIVSLPKLEYRVIELC
jgi:hypothetical protein